MRGIVRADSDGLCSRVSLRACRTQSAILPLEARRGLIPLSLSRDPARRAEIVDWHRSKNAVQPTAWLHKAAPDQHQNLACTLPSLRVCFIRHAPTPPARPPARAYVRHPATPPQSHAASGMPLTSLSPTHVTTFHLLSLSSSAPRHFFPFLPPPLASPDLTSGHASLPTSLVSRTDAGRLATGPLQSALCTGSPLAL